MLVAKKGLMIAAPRSGSGKTTITLGLLAALRRRGVAVAAAKSGPDYIDPAFHAAATGRDGINLDSWAMPPEMLDYLAQYQLAPPPSTVLLQTAATAAARVVPREPRERSDRPAPEGQTYLIIEGSMGLFDGVYGEEPRRTGAGADVAARLGAAVVLVVDVSGQSQSAAAVVRGFASHDPEVTLGGVILNRVASERHRSQVAEAIAALGIPVLGSLPREAAVILPERHLGLVQAMEQTDLAQRLDQLADLAEQYLDIDALLTVATPLTLRDSQTAPVALPPPGQRVALAQDVAFSFVYGHLLAGWRAQGAEIVPFSPLANQAPPPDCDACWLPGGYPELHAAALAAAGGFLGGLRAFAASGKPVYGECGGYMVLGQGLEDAGGVRHAMAGLLGHSTSFAKRRLNLGYRRAHLLAGCSIGAEGTAVRGHEFHYATVTDPGSDAPLVDLFDGRGQALGAAGSRRGQVAGTFFHAIAPCLA